MHSRSCMRDTLTLVPPRPPKALADRYRCWHAQCQCQLNRSQSNLPSSGHAPSQATPLPSPPHPPASLAKIANHSTPTSSSVSRGLLPAGETASSLPPPRQDESGNGKVKGRNPKGAHRAYLRVGALARPSGHALWVGRDDGIPSCISICATRASLHFSTLSSIVTLGLSTRACLCSNSYAYPRRDTLGVTP